MTRRTIDTRFFIRHFTADTDDLKTKTRKLMQELEKESAIVPTIVIHELYKDQFETLGKDTAETRTNLITQAGFEIVDLDVGIAKEAARLRCRHNNLPTADSVIAASAIKFKAISVISDDPHFKEIKEIKTVWI